MDFKFYLNLTCTIIYAMGGVTLSPGILMYLQSIPSIRECQLFCLQTIKSCYDLAVHKYPYDWRTKKPTIFRATEQWFASVEGFRQAALEAIRSVQWVPQTVTSSSCNPNLSVLYLFQLWLYREQENLLKRLRETKLPLASGNFKESSLQSFGSWFMTLSVDSRL